MVVKAVTMLDKLEYAGFAWDKLELVFPTVDLLLAEADMPEAVLSERILGYGLAQGLIKPKLNGTGVATALAGGLMPMATTGMASGGMVMPTAQQHAHSMAQQQVMLQQQAAIMAGQLGGAQLGPGGAGTLATGLGMGLQGQGVGSGMAMPHLLSGTHQLAGMMVGPHLSVPSAVAAGMPQGLDPTWLGPAVGAMGAGSGQGGTKKPVICYNCKEPGHYANKCPRPRVPYGLGMAALPR